MWFRDRGCLLTIQDFWLKGIYSWDFYGVGKLLNLSLCVLWHQPNLPGQGDPATQPWSFVTTSIFYGLWLSSGTFLGLKPKGVKLGALKSFNFSWVSCLILAQWWLIKISVRFEEALYPWNLSAWPLMALGEGCHSAHVDQMTCVIFYSHRPQVILYIQFTNLS